jgi:hypothetical protein
MGRARIKQTAAKKPRSQRFDPKPACVVVADRKSVNNYLKAHSSFGESVNVLCDYARQAFGNSAELALHLYRDPEIDDQYLTLYVRLEEYTPDVLDRIESVNKQFADLQNGLDDQIFLTTDFRRPGENHVL